MAKRKKKQRVVSAINDNLSPEVIDSTTLVDGVEYLPGLYDVSNSRFAKEHYLTYVMKPVDSEVDYYYVRYYLTMQNKDEFFQNRKTGSQKNYLLDDYPAQHDLIQEFLMLVFGILRPDNAKSWIGKDVLPGLGCFLGYLDSDFASEEINSLKDIDEQTQHNFYVYAEMKPLTRTELYYAYRFFSTLSKETGKFKAHFRTTLESIPAYPTPIIYKLDYFARQAIEEYIAVYKTYTEVMEESREMGELFTLENLLKTCYLETNVRRTGLLGRLNLLIKSKYGINPKPWRSRSAGKYSYPSKKAEQSHKKLIQISKNGIDIFPHTLPIKLCWFFKLYPNWPHDRIINPIYNGIFSGSVFKLIEMLELNLSELSVCFRPQPEVIYPLFLLLQIRTGKNTQPLTDIKVEKTTDGKYSLGLKIDDGGRKIFSVKKRTNTEDYIFLHTDKEINYYIETYLEWFGPVVYEHSKYQNFFQGHGRTSKKISFFTSSMRIYASGKFLKTYEIFDHETNKRLDRINHMRLRPSFVGAAYLRGLKEYETQNLLRHDSGTEQHLHYSNHVEVKEHKLRKIAWAQRKIVDLFKGVIVNVGKKVLTLGKGVLSDCADPKSPTHEQKPKLKSNESCSDWMFCLLCEKSRVVKELHGPVIIAMKQLLEELQEVIPAREWEKEFDDINGSIESALLHYSEEEKEEYGKTAHVHRALCENVIYMKRKRKDKLGVQNEHATA